MSTNDPLSPAELAFLELQRKPRLYAAWAELCRKNWTARQACGSDQTGGDSRTRLAQATTSQGVAAAQPKDKQ